MLCAQAKQTKEFSQHFPLAGRCSAISRKAGLHHTEQLPRKTNAITLNVPPSFFFPQLYMLSMMSYGMGCPFGQLGWLSGLCPLPSSCVPPASSLAGRCEEQKRPWLCVSTAQRELKHPCVISAVSSTNPKHSPIPATMKKIYSIPAKTNIKMNVTWQYLW